MAFVLDVTKTVGTEGTTDTSITFADWFTADDGLQAGDYIMVCASNQTGTATALALTSATGSWTKLDGIDSPRVSTVMRSQIWWHKYDGTTLPSEPTASNGANAAWAAAAWVVRDAPDVNDQSWVDVNARTDTTTSIRVHTIGSVTTTEADCLLLTVFTSSTGSAFETPDDFWGMDFSVVRAGDNLNISNPAQRVSVASRAQFTAGATTAYDYVNASPSGVRSQHWTIAIKNKVGGAKPIGIANPPTRVFDYFEDNTFTTASSVLTDLSTIHATIDGQATFAPAIISNVGTTNGLITNNPPILFWYRNFTITPPAATTGVSGVRWDLPAATDYTTGLWMLFSQRDSINQDSPAGIYHYFEDSLGNWAVYQPITRVEGSRYNTLVRYLPDEPIVDGSVTPVDLSDITRRGVAYRQILSNTTLRRFNFARECIQPFSAPLSLIGGGPSNPITARTVARMLDSGGAWRLAFTQGQGQQVITMPFQLGDGTVATYVDDEAQALEYPRAGGVIGYAVAAGRQEIRVKASASDTILLDAGIKGTSRIHDFVFDPATSTSATYGTAGTFLGFDFTAKTGVDFVGATFIGCPEIDAKGAQFNNCVIKKTASVDAAISFDTNSSMSGTTIDVTGTSADFHIELGASVTAFTLTNVTFIGTPGTAKINVLATTGTVNIALSGTALVAGDVTSAGATVNFTGPQNTGRVSNIIAGSRIRVFNVTTDTEIANEIVSGTTWTYAYDEGADFTDGDIINVRLARCTGATATIGYEGTAVAGSTGWSLFADQADDTVYNTNGVDGTTITEFTFDYPNVQVDINDPDGTTSLTRLYAWWANERTTVDGIRTLIGGLIAEDPANYKVISSRIDLKLDNTSSSGVIFIGDLRLYRDDGAAPVVSSTTGGGSITLYAGKVYTVNVGGSALTPSESAKLMSLPDSAANATAVLNAAQTAPIHADIRKVNDYAVQGEGTETNPWGPA